MSSDYKYDDQGQFFPFFILTISALVTLPLTYNLLKPSKELENTAPRIQTDFSLPDNDLIEGQKKKQRRRERKIKRFITVVVGYAVMAWMVYLIVVTQRVIPKLWDPYSILSISRSASEKEIKKQWKKLTLIHHPDKVKLSENQTMDDATDYFVELGKAYKSLTDEEVRNNFLQYGHPDGKQSFSIGIALPTFIVTEGNGKYVLLMYGLLLGVLLPYVVGKWWYGTQRLTKEKVLVTSAGKLFREWEENITKGGVVNALTCGDEYKSILKGSKSDSGLGKIEKAVLVEAGPSTTIAGLSDKDRAKLQGTEGLRRKTLALLWAYLGRVDLGDRTLNDEKYEVAPQALALNESFLAISLAHAHMQPLLATLQTSQHIIQAIPPNASPLLQLPHITPAIVKAIEGDAKVHMTLEQFMAMPEYQRRKIATDSPGTLSPKQYNTAVAVARQIPAMRVERAFFKCLGEKHVVTGSLVQFVVKARIIPPGTANVPEASPADLEDIDPDEEDLDALLGRKPTKDSRAKKADGTETKGEDEAPPLAFAPYFARDHSPKWSVFLADNKQNRVAVPPTHFTTFNKPIFGDDGKPTFHVQTIKLQFQAPPQAGSYTFMMNIICDSYIGMDSKQEVTLLVEDPAKAVEIESEDEISEPDEDSIAGQMNALKTSSAGGAPPKKRRIAKKVESDDDESDTEGEAGDDTSDTDTDTDTDED